MSEVLHDAKPRPDREARRIARFRPKESFDPRNYFGRLLRREIEERYDESTFNQHDRRFADNA